MAGSPRFLIITALGCLLAPVILLSRPDDPPADQEPAGRQDAVTVERGDSNQPSPPTLITMEPGAEPNSGESSRGQIPSSLEPTELNDQGHLQPLDQDQDEVERRISVRVSVVGKPFRILEPIRLYLWIENTSDQTMIFTRSHVSHLVFEVHAADSTGTEVPKTRHFLQRLQWGTGTGSLPLTLRPGERGMYILIANFVYDLTAPDQYTISVKVPFYTEEPFGELPLARRYWMAETNVVRINVAPFDSTFDPSGG